MLLPSISALQAGSAKSARKTLIRTERGLFNGEEMSTPTLVRCQKCGKPLGYVTVLAKGLTPLMQPLQNLKVVAICVACSQKKK